MRKSHLLNMTEGRPMKLLLVFALPLLIGNLFQQAYNLADSMIVGKLLGTNALAAVGATGSVSFLFFAMCNGISSGGGIITAQYYGAKNDLLVRRAIVNSAYIMLTSSVLTGAAAFCLVPTVLGWMGTPEEILPDAIVYMRMTTASVPLIAVYNYASSMQRALGDSRTPLYFLIFSCFLNVGLDLLFVGAFGLGVFGAALATMVAQLLAGVGSLMYAVRTNPYFRLARADLPFDRGIAKAAIRMGLPLALQWSMIAISGTALQIFTNSFGAHAVAAFTATNRLEQLVQQPFGSLSMALSTYSSQNRGANRMDRIRTGFRDSLGATAVLSVLMFTLMQVFGNQLVGLFVNDAAVIEMGGRALRITSCFYLFLGIIYATRGVLNGIGDALFAFINGIVEIAGRVGLPMLLSMIPGVGVWAVWYTAAMTWVLSGLACLARYFAWRRKSIRAESETARAETKARADIA